MSQKHERSHLDIEEPLFMGKPHIWIQWKGTDVCCDVMCSCGALLHYDGGFLYFLRCGVCGTYWEVGTHVALYETTKERIGGAVVQELENSLIYLDEAPG